MKQDEILDALNEIKRMIAEKGLEPLDVDQAAAYLRVSKSHVYSLSSRGEVAFLKPAGKRIYFLRSDLDRYLTRHRVAPREEIIEAARELSRVE